MSSTTIRPVAVKLDSGIHDRVSKLAEAKKRSPHFLMREAIAEYVEREENRESFHQEALQAWEEYKETGIHITGTEAIEWLDTWGTENESAAPTCHG